MTDRPQKKDTDLWLWLDDMRLPPWGYDLWAKTADEAISLLEFHGGKVTHCSLDHDLADEHYAAHHDNSGGYMDPVIPIDRSEYKEKTGYEVLEWMHEHDAWVSDVSVHTMNPKGRLDMLRKLEHRAPAHVSFRSCNPMAPAPTTREDDWKKTDRPGPDNND